MTHINPYISGIIVVYRLSNDKEMRKNYKRKIQMFGLQLHTFLEAYQRGRIKIGCSNIRTNGFRCSSPKTQISGNKNVNHKTSKIASHDFFILHWNKFICWKQPMNTKKVILLVESHCFWRDWIFPFLRCRSLQTSSSEQSRCVRRYL